MRSLHPPFMNRLCPAETRLKEGARAHDSDQTGGSLPLPRVGGALSARSRQYQGTAASMSNAAKLERSVTIGNEQSPYAEESERRGSVDSTALIETNPTQNWKAAFSRQQSFAKGAAPSTAVPRLGASQLQRAINRRPEAAARSRPNYRRVAKPRTRLASQPWIVEKSRLPPALRAVSHAALFLSARVLLSNSPHSASAGVWSCRSVGTRS